MAVGPQGKPMDFSFVEIHQYGAAALVKEGESFSQLLDEFYRERDKQERMRVREQDLLRLLSTHSERLSRKISASSGASWSSAPSRDALRVAGDLLSANLYADPQGRWPRWTCPTSTRRGSPLLHIQLDPALTPTQNAQKYYKEYRKAKDRPGEAHRADRPGPARSWSTWRASWTPWPAPRQSGTWRRSGRSSRSRATSGSSAAKRTSPPAAGAPMEFTTSDGFTVLVGRNNRQNDKLTLKTANNNDIWFHTKNIPGSHTVLVTQGRQPTETAMEQAAQLAALHSRAKDSSQVPVDYTQIRHVSKPAGAKPGMVVYVQYKTVFVTPGEPPASGQ